MIYIYIYNIFIYTHITYYILYMYGGWSWTEIDWLHLETTLIFNVAAWISRTPWTLCITNWVPRTHFPWLPTGVGRETTGSHFSSHFGQCHWSLANVQLGKSKRVRNGKNTSVWQTYIQDIYIEIIIYYI